MCNAPLLDWTFESLAVAGVHEVFVMCQSHFESIDEAIRCAIGSLALLKEQQVNHFLGLSNFSTSGILAVLTPRGRGIEPSHMLVTIDCVFPPPLHLH